MVWLAIMIISNPSFHGFISFLSLLTTEPSTASSVISAKALQSISSDLASEKTSQESVLEELKNLSRDLRAIRHHMDSHLQIGKKSQDWQMIGMVIDRLLFGLYIIFMLITFITIICIWSWNNSVVTWSLLPAVNRQPQTVRNKNTHVKRVCKSWLLRMQIFSSYFLQLSVSFRVKDAGRFLCCKSQICEKKKCNTMHALL